MLAIRLRRTGSKKRAFFRVVVTDSRSARDSSFVEVLGHYNPRTKPESLDLKRDRLDYCDHRGRYRNRPRRGYRQPYRRQRGAGRLQFATGVRRPGCLRPPRPLNSQHREPISRRCRSRGQSVGRSSGRRPCDGAATPRSDARRAVHGARRSGTRDRPAGAHGGGTADAGSGDGRTRGIEGYARVP